MREISSRHYQQELFENISLQGEEGHTVFGLARRGKNKSLRFSREGMKRKMFTLNYKLIKTLIEMHLILN